MDGAKYLDSPQANVLLVDSNGAVGDGISESVFWEGYEACDGFCFCMFCYGLVSFEDPYAVVF